MKHGVLGIEIEKWFRIERRDRQLDANAAGVYEIAQGAGSVVLPRLSVVLGSLLGHPAHQAIQSRKARGHPFALVIDGALGSVRFVKEQSERVGENLMFLDIRKSLGDVNRAVIHANAHIRDLFIVAT